MTVDSDGSAGREYALPLDAARADAAGLHGGDDDEANTGRSSPLFGAGISPPQKRPRASTADAAPGRQASAPGRQALLGTQEDESSSASAGTVSRVAVRRADVDEHSGTTIALGAVLVLAFGALVGVVLRRPSAESKHDVPAA